MLLHVCAVRDSAADAFGRPFVVPTLGLATRSFIDEVANPQSAFHSHPGDYTLFELGSFDDNTGKFESLESPRQIMRGQEAVTSPAA